MLCCNKASKSTLLLEISVPWITNRRSKSEEKEKKHSNVSLGLKVDNPGFTLKQVTFMIDCLGGYSADLRNNPASLGLTKGETETRRRKRTRKQKKEKRATEKEKERRKRKTGVKKRKKTESGKKERK